MAEEPQKARRRPSAKDARARMGRAVSAQTPQSRAAEQVEEFGESPETTAEAKRAVEPAEKLVRLSVDVPRSQHRYLRVLAAESGVTGMAVIRALLEESAADPDLVERVRERLGGPS